MAYIITNSSNPTRKEKNEIKEISDQNHIFHNGEFLRKVTFDNLSKNDIMVMIKESDTCIGFAYLQILEKILYINQLAIDPNYKNKELEYYLISYIKNHCKGFDTIAIYMKSSNKEVLQTLYKNGFILADNHDGEYFLSYKVPKQLKLLTFKKKITQEIIPLSYPNDLEI